MNNNQRFRVNILSPSYQKELILGGPIKTERKAAEFAVQNRINQVRKFSSRGHEVLVSVEINGVDDSPVNWYVVSMTEDGKLRITQDRR